MGDHAHGIAKLTYFHMTPALPNVLPLLHPLEEKLITYLATLPDEAWHTQTIAKKWLIKDVSAHLLDGAIRGLSMGRDGYFPPGPPPEFSSYASLVTYLNDLNETWTNALRRVSPQILVPWLQSTGKQYMDFLVQLPPQDKALFGVAWAGETQSKNEFHVAREYTERFLHQLQIRDALGDQELLETHFYSAFLSICFMAFPYSFREIDAETGTQVSILVPSSFGGQWTIEKKEEGWTWASKKTNSQSTTSVRIPPEFAWKLLSKSWRYTDLPAPLVIEGQEALGIKAAQIISFMA